VPFAPDRTANIQCDEINVFVFLGGRKNFSFIGKNRELPLLFKAGRKKKNAFKERGESVRTDGKNKDF
jgi:hypothetical protein